MKWWRWTTGAAIVTVLLSRAFSADVPSVMILETGAAVAVIAAVVAVRKSPQNARGWGMVVAGLVCWWFGDLAFDFFRLRDGEPPAVSLADALYLLGYPLIAVGCVRLIRQERLPGARDGLLDGIAFGSAASLAAWRFLVEPTIADGGSTVERVVLAAYPLGDVLLLALVSWLALIPGRHRRPSLILAGFLGAIFLVDIAYAIATHTESLSVLLWLDAAYPMAYTLPAIAMMQTAHRSTPRPELGLHPARVLFLGISLWLIPVLTIATVGVKIDRSVVALLASAATTAAVLARFVFVVRDRDRIRQHLIHVASHDPLTGLANRRLFMDRLDRACVDPGRQAALIFIDLDGLKVVNDCYGHDVGDLVLIEVGKRLDAHAPPAFLSARLGGDEFAIVCDDVADGFSPQDLADRLLVSLREDPLRLADGTNLGITASVGVVTFAGGTANAEAFIKHADDAMYEAKRAGGDRLAARAWHHEDSPISTL
ncbi:MAG TPA: GGDEF domain-containing protein [Acidimicrobiales bacterium]|nr:GGDEF domain-containing protein [Acidimicrobiales bacterium]